MLNIGKKMAFSCLVFSVSACGFLTDGYETSEVSDAMDGKKLLVSKVFVSKENGIESVQTLSCSQNIKSLDFKVSVFRKSDKEEKKIGVPFLKAGKEGFDGRVKFDEGVPRELSAITDFASSERDNEFVVDIQDWRITVNLLLLLKELSDAGNALNEFKSNFRESMDPQALEEGLLAAKANELELRKEVESNTNMISQGVLQHRLDRALADVERLERLKALPDNSLENQRKRADLEKRAADAKSAYQAAIGITKSSKDGSADIAGRLNAIKEEAAALVRNQLIVQRFATLDDTTKAFYSSVGATANDSEFLSKIARTLTLELKTKGGDIITTFDLRNKSVMKVISSCQ